MSLSEQNLSALEASSFPSTPAGRPRLNQRERHLHRLYEPLTLLSTLIHGQQACEPKSASELRREGVYKPWHRYVDQLCWLCDFECGGKSIASIAVQASSPGPVYWLAINKKFAAKALSYLDWILSELVKLHGLSSDQQQKVEAEIVARSIEMSSDRVKNYGKWLCNAIQEVLEKWSLQIGQQDSAGYLVDSLSTSHCLLVLSYHRCSSSRRSSIPDAAARSTSRS